MDQQEIAIRSVTVYMKVKDYERIARAAKTCRQDVEEFMLNATLVDTIEILGTPDDKLG